MSTSLLYHGFKIIGYRFLSVAYKNGSIFFFGIDQDRFKLRCPACNSRQIIRKGSNNRRFRNLPIGTKPTFIDFAIPRVKCLKCGVIQQAKIGFADSRRTYTKAFERYVLELSRHMTIKDVAKHLNTSWDIVKDIQKSYLGKRFKFPRLKHLRIIAIDEISIGRGHRYLTVALDLSTGAVVHVGDGKGADALAVFWKRLKRCKADIKAVAIDMSPAYIAAVLENLPEAAIVFDRFHVMKLYNDKLSEFRWQLQRECENPLQLEVLKGTRWLLLKNAENLNTDPGKNEKERLAKKAFKEISDYFAIYRGKSNKPLYVTSEGMEIDTAKKLVSTMSGRFRVPTLLKRVDHVCRSEPVIKR